MKDSGAKCRINLKGMISMFMVLEEKKIISWEGHAGLIQRLLSKDE